jgi:type VI secretion system protein ImpF
MPPEANQQGLMPSIIDRLIDPESAGTVARHGYSVPQMVEAVRRDLEELLNSRRAMNEIPEKYAELRRSVLNYGMPEVVNLPALTGEQRQQIGRILEQVIAFFEPRLRDVRARLVGPTDLRDRSVRFHVEGRLRVEPAPEVEFETVLELSSGRAGVQAATQGAG